MPAQPTSISAHFAALPDPRVERTKEHRLVDILTIGLCAVLRGAEGWTAMEAFGRAKESWLRTCLALPGSIPSHDTFGRVFARLDPDAFGRCFVAWVQAVAPETLGHLRAVDGKTLRGSRDRANGQAPLHLVGAWAGASGLVLGQVAVDDQSNEITAIPLLLRLLDLAGCTVTIDALGCQTAIAAQIAAQGGDYVLALKDDQPTLHKEVLDAARPGTARPSRPRKALGQAGRHRAGRGGAARRGGGHGRAALLPAERTAQRRRLDETYPARVLAGVAALQPLVPN